jgi:hypothetical protein
MTLLFSAALIHRMYRNAFAPREDR